MTICFNGPAPVADRPQGIRKFRLSPLCHERVIAQEIERWGQPMDSAQGFRTPAAGEQRTLLTDRTDDQKNRHSTTWRGVMIGGLRGAASRLALAALLGAMGAIAFVQQPARAADLGGDCCADLEERVAELEATTARKGNNKVSVQVYGKLNRFVAFWDDGAEQNQYVENNSYSSTRFGFRGKAKIGGDWSGGYRIELEDETALSKNNDQFAPDGDDADFGEFNVRHSYWYIDQKKYGQVRVGLT